MKIPYIITIILFVFSLSTLAQNVEFKGSNFKSDKEGFKTALENLKAGNNHFEAGLVAERESEVFFYKAYVEFIKANNFNPDNADLNYNIGKCIFELNRLDEAYDYLKKAIELEPEENPGAYFLLGRSSHQIMNFDEAEKYYGEFESRSKTKDLEAMKRELNKAKTELKHARELISNPGKRLAIAAFDNVNTEYDDFCASITADEYMLFFNSRRGEKSNDKNDFDAYYSDIYYITKEEGGWTDPVLLGDPLNTPTDDMCLSLSPDGQQMFIYKEEDGAGNLYISKLQGEDWSGPEKLPEGKINTGYNESHASFYFDDITVYYVSDNPYANKGGKDLFLSGKIITSHTLTWGKAHPMGSELNTPFDEGSVFMHPDGKTVYFSSKGHNSMGGYDIFKSVRLPGRWSEPINLGYPINTTYDETFFVISANGKHAYITSNREGGKGGKDIYRITFLGAPKPNIVDMEDHLLASETNPIREASLEKVRESDAVNLTVLKGKVLDDFTSQPVEASIEIVDNKKNTVISTFKSNSSTGRFLVSLPAGKNYGIAVSAKDYLFHSENFNLPQMSDYQLVDKEIRLKNVCIGCKIVLRNIFFDTGKFSLRAESTAELNRLVELINDIARVKPGIKVEISGHTDNVGSEKLNLTLSENRAKAVVEYLVRNGVDKSKLVYKGYGPSQPVAGNNTSSGRQKNRRTEFKILEN